MYICEFSLFNHFNIVYLDLISSIFCMHICEIDPLLFFLLSANDIMQANK